VATEDIEKSSFEITPPIDASTRDARTLENIRIILISAKMQFLSLKVSEYLHTFSHSSPSRIYALPYIVSK